MIKFLLNLFKSQDRYFTRKTVIAKGYDGKEFRFKVHKENQIWLEWFGYPFPLEIKATELLSVRKKASEDITNLIPDGLVEQMTTQRNARMRNINTKTIDSW